MLGVVSAPHSLGVFLDSDHKWGVGRESGPAEASLCPTNPPGGLLFITIWGYSCILPHTPLVLSLLEDGGGV